MVTADEIYYHGKHNSFILLPAVTFSHIIMFKHEVFIY